MRSIGSFLSPVIRSRISPVWRSSNNPLKRFGILITLIVAVLVTSAVAQQQSSESELSTSWVPRAMIFGGPSFLGNGYQNFAGNIGGGFLLNADKLLGDFEAAYMNAREVDDSTLNNRKGHERLARGRLFYPLHRRLYFGGGAQWAETSTANYTRSAWRPTFGMGTDRLDGRRTYRLQGMYILPSNDHRNALQGPEIQFWIPSPLSSHHFFYADDRHLRIS